MTSIKEWSKKRKIAVGSAAGAVLALAVVLAVWQPWKAPETEKEVPQPPQREEPEKPEEDEGLTLAVGLEEIPCVLYEGDGWSVYVPETWTIDAGDDGGVFASPDGKAQVEVGRYTVAPYIGVFASASREDPTDGEEQRLRRFYAGDLSGAWEVTGRAPKEDWEDQQKLLTALARTFTAGEERPFAELYPVASEPSWQTVDGDAILWLDKDGYPVKEGVGDAVRDHMLDWSDEVKKCFTGQYRLEALTWAGSYTCIGEGYIDIFTTPVWYERAEGVELRSILEHEWEREDGWMRDQERLAVAVFHDGSDVAKALALWISDEAPGEPVLASRLAGELGISGPQGETALTTAELEDLEDYFNDRENNGLLRFELDPGKYHGLAENLENYLVPLFYDLGEWDFTDAEREMFQEKVDAGEWLELDESRLSREYIAGYLYQKFGLDAEATDALLAGTPEPPGDYAEEFDAWYMCHGDTAMHTYVFDTGYRQTDGRIEVRYTNPFIWGPAAGDGESDVPMRLVIGPSDTEPDGWRVLSNTVVE